MQLTKLRAAPVWQAEVPPCAPAGRMVGGTASQLIRSVMHLRQGRPGYSVMDSTDEATGHARRQGAPLNGMVVLGMLALAGCGSSVTKDTAEVPCDQVRWGFRLNKADGSDWVGSSPLKPGQTMVLTLSDTYFRPGTPGVSDACVSKATGLSWESSAPAVASVSPLSSRSATVTARVPGTADIIVRFLFAGVTPMSTYLRVEVANPPPPQWPG